MNDYESGQDVLIPDDVLAAHAKTHLQTVRRQDKVTAMDIGLLLISGIIAGAWTYGVYCAARFILQWIWRIL